MLVLQRKCETCMKFIFFIVFIILLVISGIWAFSYVSEIKKDLGLSLKAEKPKKIVGRFAVFADTHNDLAMVDKALRKAAELEVEYIMHLGDWTNLGTVEELQKMKEKFEASKIPYWGTLGDHDLWQSGSSNFESVFGKTYQSLDKNGLHHIFLNSSDTKKGLGREQLEWLKADLEKNKSQPRAGGIFMYMHLPLYHPLNYRTIWEKGGENEEVKKEVDELLPLLKKYSIKAAFAGDHHLASDYLEPVSHVKMYAIGALTSERNLQKSRFSVVSVFEDGGFSVEEVVLQ